MLSNGYADITHIKPQKFDVTLPMMEAIENEVSPNPYTSEKFRTVLKSSAHDVLLAEVDGKVLGYVLYEREAKQFKILKLEVDRAYEDYGIREQLVAGMVGKLNALEGRPRLMIEVHVDDVALQKALKKSGFVPNKKTPLRAQAFPNGDTAVALEYDIAPKVEVKPSVALMHYDPELVLAQSGEHRDSPPSVPFTRGEIVLAALGKLHELTGVTWEAVKADDSGAFVALDISRHYKNDKGIHLRTVDLMADPPAAQKALQHYFGVAKKAGHAAQVRRACRVDFPSSWVRPIHLMQGTPNQLAEHFTRVIELPDFTKPGMRPRGEGGVLDKG